MNFHVWAPTFVELRGQIDHQHSFEITTATFYYFTVVLSKQDADTYMGLVETILIGSGEISSKKDNAFAFFFLIT